jgi:hypothetical protein
MAKLFINTHDVSFTLSLLPVVITYSCKTHHSICFIYIRTFRRTAQPKRKKRFDAFQRAGQNCRDGRQEHHCSEAADAAAAAAAKSRPMSRASSRASMGDSKAGTLVSFKHAYLPTIKLLFCLWQFQNR